jgi:hypothetical protein
VRSAEGVQRVGGFLGVGGNAGHGRGDVGFGHDLLGERLGSLQLGSFLTGAEHRNTGFADGIGNTGSQWGLGSNHNQVHTQLGGEGGHGFRVVPVNSVRGNEFADARVAGGRVDLGDVGVFKQRADNGVFAAAWANDEYLHGFKGTLCRPRGLSCVTHRTLAGLSSRHRAGASVAGTRDAKWSLHLIR